MNLLRKLAAVAVALGGLLAATPAAAQVTSASMRGSVTDEAGKPIEGARVVATHRPSGTVYQATSRADGRFSIPGMRVGGPYTVAVTRIGYARASQDGIQLTLGVSADISLKLGQAAQVLGGVTVTSSGGDLSKTRTGAATSVTREALENLPTISRRIGDFTRLTPQASGTSFAGQDNRLNNITVDGTSFNNSFGLQGQPGDRTGVAPISLDAIEAVQVNIAPYDVRQGNFTGATVNTVTRSGTNDFTGSLYYLTRNEGYLGRDAGATKLPVPGKFDFSQFGGRIGGPIIKNKLFFFASYEQDENVRPATTFTANTGSQTVGGTTTRVLASELDALSTYMKSNFNYETGPYQGYDFETPSKKFLTRLDWNINERNKLSFRYNMLKSSTDVIISSSSSLGFGGRAGTTNALSFANSNYSINENILSYVAEWNSQIGKNMANNMIAGYTFQDESRGSKGTFFPLVEILNNNTAYTSLGFEPFTPNNELRYWTRQFQNNFVIYGEKNDLTLGVAAELYKSENVFFPGSQSVYVYNSLADFYTDANGYLANPNRTTSPVTLRQFQVRWANIPGQAKPVQPLEVTYLSAYAQDEWRPNRNLTVTVGLRADVPSFGATGFANANTASLTFRDENGQPAKFNTEKLPNTTVLWSPRFGFNWDLDGRQTTQVRGGTGIFTGRPAYVWISNQIGNNGVITGFESQTNTTARPFNPNPNAYKPTSVTGAPASSYELALTDPNFRFPQVWRTNIAVDRKLPWGFVGTAEFIYSRDVNGVYYYDANLAPATGTFTGADNRPRWTGDTCPTVSGTQQRVNCNVTNAIVLKNQDVGYAWNASASLERAFRNGFFMKTAYSYGIARNTVDAGSIAFGSWSGNPTPGNPNLPGVGFSGNTAGHRVIAAASYTKKLLPIGATSISMFLEGRTFFNTSYTVSGDMNGDLINNNDLIYVPKSTAEMNFEPYTVTVSGVSRTFTAAEQAAAWDAYINQDKYLNSRRGQYTERGAVFAPMVWRGDLTITQDLSKMIGARANKFQLRADVINATNLLNKNWGVGQRMVSNQPLIARGADASGAPLYRFRAFGTDLQRAQTFEKTASFADTWALQIGFRYSLD